ncbi:NAD(P)H-dependent oxidoreductase [Actinokineospora fastidiosa]|uniref:NADPH-dependent FMN reductase-like domain-containing protein n=1 Tax=Actinokineospora fastidiosa TaxID=1816 RepID=A0A918G201_9PSEU|nr:NAD(P)H-dependent oxidoreductase [Actinokineospora fastidiosa]GGS12557.1 hypothetical protein GCM10010171_00250 [Actinokineospora fastidiosa]
MEPAVVVSGGMTPGGAVGLLAEHASAVLDGFGHPVALIEACALPAVALLECDRSDPAIAAALADLAGARGMVLVAPVNRAAHCGLVKSVLDLLPRGALAGLPILPVTTGGRQGRGAVEFCVTPLLRELGATRLLRGPFVPEADLAAGVPARVADALAEFSLAVGRRRRLAG